MGDDSVELEYADSQDVTPAEAAALILAVAELTKSLNAFIQVAEELFPHPDMGLPLMKRIRAWRAAQAGPTSANTVPPLPRDAPPAPRD